MHFSNVDGMRGLACLIVLVDHAAVLVFPELTAGLTGCGKIGVWLFFVLSAYLLTAKLTDKAPGSEALLGYARSRIVRIYPLYVLAVAVYFAFGFMGAGAFFKSLAMVTAWNHLWTIPVEMSFYVLLPAIAWPLAALNRRLGAGAVLLAASVLLLVQLLSFPFYATPDNSLNVGWYVPAFLFGCVAAVLKDAWQVRPGFRDALVLAILAGVAVSTPIAREALFGFEPTADLMNKHAFFGLAFAVLIWCVVDKASNWSAFFGARVMAYVGNISYPTYLLHWLVIVGLKDHLPQSWFTVLFFVAGSLALGAVAHMFIERPLMSWLKPSARRQPAYQT